LLTALLLKRAALALLWPGRRRGRRGRPREILPPGVDQREVGLVGLVGFGPRRPLFPKIFLGSKNFFAHRVLNALTYCFFVLTCPKRGTIVDVTLELQYLIPVVSHETCHFGKNAHSKAKFDPWPTMASQETQPRTLEIRSVYWLSVKSS